MNAQDYLKEALGGNMNISTLTPFAFEEIMDAYTEHIRKENVRMRKVLDDVKKIVYCEQWDSFEDDSLKLTLDNC